MAYDEGRQKDLLLMAIAIQLSVIVAILPGWFPLVFISALITISVVMNETIRRYHDRGDRKQTHATS